MLSQRVGHNLVTEQQQQGETGGSSSPYWAFHELEVNIQHVQPLRFWGLVYHSYPQSVVSDQ